MRKNIYLIIISFCFVSCYTYQVKKPADPSTENKESKKNPAVSNVPNSVQNGGKPNPNTQQMPVVVNIQEKLAANKNVKIDVDGKSYKVIVDRWENDSLVAHPVNKPSKILKFHENQINADKIAEKRFSQPIADIITVAVYVGIGVAIYSLLR